MYTTAVETELIVQGLGYCRQTSAQLFPVTSGHLNQTNWFGWRWGQTAQHPQSQRQSVTN